MRQRTRACLLLLSSSLLALKIAPQTPGTIASLGECQLESGAVLKDCHLSYRVWGAFNATRTNVVLLPAWGQGTSAGWAQLLGAEGYVDTTRFAAVAVDGFGAGQSSSPGDSAWRGRTFPTVTIRDMVDAAHELLARQLHVTEPYAIIGYSMGGMQAFEWAVAYPAAVKRVVSIEGSPRVANYDRVLVEAFVHLLTTERGADGPTDSAFVQLVRLSQLSAPPTTVNARTPDDIAGQLRVMSKGLARFGADNILLQLRAELTHDAAHGFGGDASAAQRAIRARMLVVTSPDDHVVSQEPALAWARGIGADTLVVPSACGHSVIFCERGRIAAAVRDFLSK